MTTAGSLSCPNCGAAAAPDDRECTACRARLATVACPLCFGLVFVGSRHCAHCGARARQPEALDGAPWRCPHGHGSLRGIALGGAEIGECLACAGLWLDEATFDAVIDARAQPTLVPFGGALQARRAPVPDRGVRYLPCPDCGARMRRVHFARVSGVVLDRCAGHGVWCDTEKLRRAIEFVRAGGLPAPTPERERLWQEANRARREFLYGETEAEALTRVEEAKQRRRREPRDG